MADVRSGDLAQGGGEDLAPSSQIAATMEVFRTFLSLGLTSFGGPVAHLGYFRTALVERRQWLTDSTYADLVALCQFLPGPASSQVGMAVGYARAGYAGAAAAFIAFTAPSALVMLVIAYGAMAAPMEAAAPLLHGLKLAAVAVVAQAVMAMARNLTPDLPRQSIAVAAASAALILPGALAQIGVILLGAMAGLRWSDATAPLGPDAALPAPSRRAGAGFLLAFFVALAALPLAALATGDPLLAALDVFYRAGALVFGGGHVVLPMLEAGLVPKEMSKDIFLAGYGAAQALPGPLFALAAFLGAAMKVAPDPALGGLIALLAIFLPAALLVFGGLPFWAMLRGMPKARRALAGVNAAVVGLLIAALYDPVFIAGVGSPPDLALVLVGLLLLEGWKMPPWLIVAVSAPAGYALTLL